MQNKKENIIVDLTFQFALNIIEFSDLLESERKYVIAKQLLRSGTSIGSSVREAQNAESKLDFVHKMKIAAKEADETEYWLLLCKYAKSYPMDEKLLESVGSVIKVLSKIIGSSKKKNEINLQIDTLSNYQIKN